MLKMDVFKKKLYDTIFSLVLTGNIFLRSM